MNSPHNAHDLTSYTTSSVSLLLELLPPVSLTEGLNILLEQLMMKD